MKYQYTYQTPHMPKSHTTTIVADSEPHPDDLRDLIVRRSAVLIEDPDRIVISGIREVIEEGNDE